MTSGSLPGNVARFDALIHPVTITGQCAIGDQIMVPALWCAMADCDAAFADPAALGEADNRARAIAAGWAKDALCRLVCPACRRDRPVPVWWVPAQELSTFGEHRPASGTPRPVDDSGRSDLSDPSDQWAGSFAPGGQPAAAEATHHRTHWPRLFSALVSNRDGRTPRAGSRTPEAVTIHDQAPAYAPRHGQDTHDVGSAGRRA